MRHQVLIVTASGAGPSGTVRHLLSRLRRSVVR